ncbi:MAG: MerR family transcriptional regulator [Acidimicrobiales bacterium]
MTITGAATGRYRIAEIAQLSGFSPSTLRYYEHVGVLAATERTPAGYRLYSARDLERLRLIARAKDLGCSLDEITELVRAWDDDECGPVKHRLRALVHNKVLEVETHLADQAAFADQLRATAAALAGRPLDGPCDDSCGCTATTASQEATSRGCGTDCGCGTAGRAVPLGRRAHEVDAVPIACSLSGADMGERIEDWQRVIDGVSRRQIVPGGMRLGFGDRSRITELAALVEAEQTCCPFFSFAITIDQSGLALEVTAPADGQDLLAAVFGDHS